MRITFVLWRGDIGGAERVTVEVARALGDHGIATRVVFVTNEYRLAEHLVRSGVAFDSLGLARGRDVVRSATGFARLVRGDGADVAIVVQIGYLAAVLRAGGFRGPIIGVEHGGLLEIERERPLMRAARLIDRAVGATALEAEVAVSAMMMNLVARYPHAPCRLIEHGVEPPLVSTPLPSDEGLVLGFVGRHHRGKGVDIMLRAIHHLERESGLRSVRAVIAGDGPMRAEWERLTDSLGLQDRVEFTGWIESTADLWARCHVAAVVNDRLPESFCLSLVEAMASGRTAIVSQQGAAPSLLRPPEFGRLVAPGDVRGLAQAINEYVVDRPRVIREGHFARRRALSEFSLDTMATRYASLAADCAVRARAPWGRNALRVAEAGARQVDRSFREPRRKL